MMLCSFLLNFNEAGGERKVRKKGLVWLFYSSSSSSLCKEKFFMDHLSPHPSSQKSCLSFLFFSFTFLFFIFYFFFLASSSSSFSLFLFLSLLSWSLRLHSCGAPVLVVNVDHMLLRLRDGTRPAPRAWHCNTSQKREARKRYDTINIKVLNVYVISFQRFER